MKRLVALVLSALLLLTGCGANSESDQQEAEAVVTTSAVPRPAETTEAEELIVSPNTTCELMLSDDGGIVVETSEFLRDVEEINEDTAAQAEDLSERLGGYAESAEEDLASLIKIMREPVAGFVEAWEGSLKGDTTWSFEAPRYQAASSELVNICQPLLPDAAAAPEEPTAMPTTGDFEADMKGVGLVTDSFDYYAEMIIPRVCESDLDSVLTGFVGDVRSLRGGGENDNQLRMIATYHCPDRLDDLEEAFIYLNDE